MTLLEEIEALTWYDGINKLKSILKRLFSSSNTYTSYTALLTQTGTQAPTITELRNNTGQAVALAYSTVGEYIATFSGTIDQNKLWFSATPSAKAPLFMSMGYNSVNSAVLNVYASSGAPSNNLLSHTPIEIRIYN